MFGEKYREEQSLSGNAATSIYHTEGSVLAYLKVMLSPVLWTRHIKARGLEVNINKSRKRFLFTTSYKQV